MPWRQCQLAASTGASALAVSPPELLWPAASGANVAVEVTRFCTWLSSSSLPSAVLNCSMWYQLPKYQLLTVSVSVLPMTETFKS
jgi:hypothetical protein